MTDIQPRPLGRASQPFIQRPDVTQPGNQNFDIPALIGSFRPFQSIEERMEETRDWFRQYSDQAIGVNSSLGTQSVLMLQFLKNSGLQIPVISIDIPDAKYDAQRTYRDHIAKETGLDIRVFKAASEDDKADALERALKSLNIGLVFNGLRKTQTEHRETRSFAQWNDKRGRMEVSPIFDWSDDRVDFHIRKLPETLRHPDFGKLTKGGAILDEGVEKDECNLWID